MIKPLDKVPLFTEKQFEIVAKILEKTLDKERIRPIVFTFCAMKYTLDCCKDTQQALELMNLYQEVQKEVIKQLTN